MTVLTDPGEHERRARAQSAAMAALNWLNMVADQCSSLSHVKFLFHYHDRGTSAYEWVERSQQKAA